MRRNGVTSASGGRSGPRTGGAASEEEVVSVARALQRTTDAIEAITHEAVGLRARLLAADDQLESVIAELRSLADLAAAIIGDLYDVGDAARTQTVNGQSAPVRQEGGDLTALFATLTPREQQVLEGILIGKLNKQVAADLGISQRTVEHHRHSLMRKLGVKNPAMLGRIDSLRRSLPERWKALGQETWGESEGASVHAIDLGKHARLPSAVVEPPGA